jgi:hypothetical protein
MDRIEIDIIDFINFDKLEKHISINIKDQDVINDILNGINEQLKDSLPLIVIKTCEYCGREFLSKGNYDTKYCDRIIENGLSCKVVGGRKTTYEKIENTPILKLYDRYYKRYKARIRNKNMNGEQFNQWKEKAKNKRNTSLNIEEYKQWLDNYETENLK